MTDGALLWHVNRSTGLVLMALLTVTVLLGVWSTRGGAGTRVPRFVVQAVHRNIGLLSVVMLLLHVGSAVADEYVDIRWWQVVLPVGLRYDPGWLAIGIAAGDLMVAVAVTSLLRHRLPRRGWWLLHASAYPTWLLALAHGLGIGTDAGAGWARWLYAGCAVAVLGAVLLRLVASGRREAVPAGALR